MSRLFHVALDLRAGLDAGARGHVAPGDRAAAVDPRHGAAVERYVRAILLMTGEDILRLLRARAAEVVVGVELEAAREAVREVLGGRGGEEEGLRGAASSRSARKKLLKRSLAL